MKKIVTLLAILSCVVGPVFSQIRYTAAVVDDIPPLPFPPPSRDAILMNKPSNPSEI